jgi:ribosomal protein S27E
MKRIGIAEFEVQLLKGMLSSVQSRLEVSLDCSDCKRRHRTVVFDRPGARGRCTPTGHEFKGLISSIDDRVAGAVAKFEYEYEPFTDAKYPDEKRYAGFERGAPSWVRFHFSVRCLKCGSTSAHSTQTNIVRPWKCTCTCGAPLYVDMQAPRMGWSNEEA